MDEFKLWCYVEGDYTYFGVSVSPDHTIDELKERIYGKKEKAFIGCDTSDLYLKKVRYIMTSMSTSM